MDIKSDLSNILRGRVTIIGAGNVMRGDDGLGPVLADRLKDRISASVINGGSAPENHLGAIKGSKPDVILVIDAADFGGKSGEIKLLKRSDVPVYGHSTHNMSFALFFEFLETETKADIYMLAVQPERNGINASLSGTMSEKCRELESFMLELLPAA